MDRDQYARTIAIGPDRGVLTVRPLAGDRLGVEVRFPRLTALPAIIARVRRVFDLAADPLAIGAQLGQDAALAPLLAARPGLRVPGAWDGFELAIRAILGQQITVAAATALAGKIVAAHGDPLPPEFLGEIEGLTHVFPSPAALADADLACLGMARARAASLSSLAAAVLADPLILGARRSLEEAIAQLKALPGIGEWTAQYIAMRELREPDAFPHGDIGLMRALVGADGRRPSAAELLARAEAWRPWRAYLHLWASETPPAAREKANDRTGRLTPSAWSACRPRSGPRSWPPMRRASCAPSTSRISRGGRRACCAGITARPNSRRARPHGP